MAGRWCPVLSGRRLLLRRVQGGIPVVHHPRRRVARVRLSDAAVAPVAHHSNAAVSFRATRGCAGAAAGADTGGDFCPHLRLELEESQAAARAQVAELDAAKAAAGGREQQMNELRELLIVEASRAVQHAEKLVVVAA